MPLALVLGQKSKPLELTVGARWCLISKTSGIGPASGFTAAKAAADTISEHTLLSASTSRVQQLIV
jgi:hypothetical protein